MVLSDWWHVSKPEGSRAVNYRHNQPFYAPYNLHIAALLREVLHGCDYHSSGNHT